VQGRAPRTGYNRDQFGPAWADVDANGIEAAQFDPDGVAGLTAQAFAAAQRGEIRPSLGPTYALTDTARAHTDIEARTATGETVLITAAGGAHGLTVSA